MATHRNNAARMPSVADTTSFRNWIIDFVAMMEGSGWAQSSDIGQLDETTVTYPAAVSTVAGWQMWYLNDSLHSTYPLYLKVTFGRGSSGSRVSLTMQFGYATDGSGTFVGWSGSVISFMPGSGSGDAPSAATGVNAGSGGEGYAWFCNGRSCWTSGAGMHAWLHVAREFDDDGQVVANGNWSYVYQSPSTVRPYSFAVNRAMQLAFSATEPVCSIPFGTTQSGTATETELWRWLMKFPKVTPMATLFTYMSGDIQMDAPFQSDVSGALRTYLPTGLERCSTSSSGSHMAAMIWE